MNIAIEKLVTIAENVQKVYNSGYAAGRESKGMPLSVDIRTIKFDDWHVGAAEDTVKEFGHNLDAMPRYVAIFANDPSAIEKAVLPSGNITAILMQTDRLYNIDTKSFYTSSYIRCANGTTMAATLPTENRLITGWDASYVYVNAAASSYAWPPSTITTFTMICIA